MGDQSAVQLCDRVTASIPLFDELGEIRINAGRSRARLLFWKGTMPQPARNSGMTNPYLFSNGRLRETLLAQGHDLLVLG
jgi:hypothetical protein